LIGKRLGKGAFGEVLIATHVATQKKFAIKHEQISGTDSKLMTPEELKTQINVSQLKNEFEI